ncbi:MAG: (deoxy)nucleoside triphosphate pyrophosphohydrolase [Acidobacteriota bacterium]
MPQKPLRLQIAVAVLCAEDKIWIQKRRETRHLDGFWEFPGGKIERGESPEEALSREVREEIGLRVDPDRMEKLLIEDHDYPERPVRIHFFLCRFPSLDLLIGQVKANGFWASADQLAGFKFPPANRRVIETLLVLV